VKNIIGKLDVEHQPYSSEVLRRQVNKNVPQPNTGPKGCDGFFMAHYSVCNVLRRKIFFGF